MTTIILYAIRHKPTGNYIPESFGVNGRGGSHLEPVPATSGKFTRPRFFHTERAARIFLTGWLKGKVVAWAGYDSHTGEYDSGLDTVPVPTRIAAEMEIIPYSVELL